MCEYDENDTDENIIDESESRSTKFMTNQIAKDLLAIIIWSITNNIKFKFKAFTRMLVIFNNCGIKYSRTSRKFFNNNLLPKYT